MAWIEHDHADRDSLVAHLVELASGACECATRERGRAWMALAGGRTPLPVFAGMAGAARGCSLAIVPTDERCVPHEHPACNARAMREAFAGHPAATVAPLTRDDGDPAASLAHATSLLALNPQPFDLVLLGMGGDGHIASLFPGAPDLARGLDPRGDADVLAIVPDPLPAEAPFPRISLSLARLLRAREVHLVATGEDKRRVLRQAQHQEVAADPAQGLPVAALLHARDHRLHVHWSP